MTENDKMSSHHAPRGQSFADMVRGLESAAKIFREGPQAEGIAAILACIREQQAALEGIIRVADRMTDEFAAARAALRKWRIE